jgi:hypothetical protein
MTYWARLFIFANSEALRCIANCLGFFVQHFVIVGRVFTIRNEETQSGGSLNESGTNQHSNQRWNL